MPDDSCIYDKRIVLFLDILGFRTLINAGREAELLEILKIPVRLQSTWPYDGSTSMRLTAFSDSIVISDVVGDDDFPYQRLVYYASYLTWKFLVRGILVRGGFAVGPLHHEQNVLFGPAMVEAYQLESEFAIYPRIAVSAGVREGLFRQADSEGYAAAPITRSILKRDFDGVWYVDFLSMVGVHPTDELFPEKRPLPGGEGVSFETHEIAARMAEKIEAILNSRPQNHLRAEIKYNWLANSYDLWRRQLAQRGIDVGTFQRL